MFNTNRQTKLIQYYLDLKREFTYISALKLGGKLTRKINMDCFLSVNKYFNKPNRRLNVQDN